MTSSNKTFKDKIHGAQQNNIVSFDHLGRRVLQDIANFRKLPHLIIIYFFKKTRLWKSLKAKSTYTYTDTITIKQLLIKLSDVQIRAR